MSGTCRRCGASEFGSYTSSTTGKVSRYCRPCRGQRAVKYLARTASSAVHHTRSQWLTKLAATPACMICQRAWEDIPPRPNKRYKHVWTKDHTIPVSLGGSDAIENIEAVCYQCNFGKCNRVSQEK